MRCVLRGVRVIDPGASVDAWPRDVWIDEGRLRAVDIRIDAPDTPIVDLTPHADAAACVICPGFIDLHAHLREPGDEDAETVRSGALAAAAGGFTTVVAMANTRPAIDTSARVADACARASAAPLNVLQVSAVTRGLAGVELVDVAGTIAAGAVALSDDGRNAMPADVLERALRLAADASRPVLVHPEDERSIAAGDAHGDVVRCSIRPAESEVRAVATAIDALERAGRGRLHLQHVTAAASVEMIARARDRGLAVTAEVTPHHLVMTMPSDARGVDPLWKVNPPLRTDDDRAALRAALREGVIDAVATDHAPHPAARKAGSYDDASPGMIGLETALALCITAGGMENELPLLVQRLTTGPHRVIGEAADMGEPRLRVGEPLHATLFDPAAEWVVGDATLHSRSRNTPLIGRRLRGRVLLTLAEGRVVHSDERVPGAAVVAHV